VRQVLLVELYPGKYISSRPRTRNHDDVSWPALSLGVDPFEPAKTTNHEVFKTILGLLTTSRVTMLVVK